MNVSNLEVFAVVFHPRWRKDWKVRLGFKTAPVTPGSVWVHGASIGECQAAAALAKRLTGPVLLTSDTPEGKRAAQECLTGTSHVVVAIRPADHPWTLAPLWAEARPSGLVFVEGSWWPELAAKGASSGVPVMRVSAKVGPRSRRFGRWGVYRRWTRAATYVDARDRSSAEWFAVHQDAPVSCSGDLKVDAAPGRQGVVWARPFVVGACTHPGEESLLLLAVEKVRDDHGLLLAPRDVSRVPALVKWLQRRGVSHALASELDGGQVPPHISVVLLDSYGMLAASLEGATATFIGGTFKVRVGGHSPFEAWRAGVPIVTGPHIWAHESAFTEAGAWTASDEQGLADGLQFATPPCPVQTGVARHLASEIALRCTGWAPESSPRPWALRWAVVWAWLARQRASPRRFEGLPVVAVGSENARGAGKTTAGRWVAGELARRGYRVGVVARGYKRQNGKAAVLHHPGMPGANLGDDAALYAMDGHVVATGPQRMEACRLVWKAGADIVVLEDGLQQGQVCPDWSVAVIDADFPNARGAIPGGEKRPRFRDADVTLCLNGQLDAPVIEGTVSHCWYQGDQIGTPPDDLAVFVGTGRPGVVRNAMSPRVSRFRSLGDHGNVDAGSWRGLQRWAQGLPLACTAKDYVRIQHLPGTEEVWWLEQTAAFENPHLVLPPSKFPGARHSPGMGPAARTVGENP